MRSILKKIFIANWQRKLISLILAIIVWLLLNNLIITTKSFNEIPVKVTSMPSGFTMDHMLSDNYLDFKVPIQITGKKNFLDSISSSDLEIVVDGQHKIKDWIVQLNKNNLKIKSSKKDFLKNIKSIEHDEFILKPTNIISEKCSVLVNVKGNPPIGYEFINVYPRTFHITVYGSQRSIEKIKKEGIYLNVDLNMISEEDLESIIEDDHLQTKDEIIFSVPNSWKKINLPSQLNSYYQLDNSNSELLYINLIKKNPVQISNSLPISFFINPKQNLKSLIHNYEIVENEYITKVNDIYLLKMPIYVSGVSDILLNLIKDMIQVSIFPSNKNSSTKYNWSCQIINVKKIEEEYVQKASQIYLNHSTINQDPNYISTLKNLFKASVNNFKLCTKDGKDLSLDIRVDDENQKIYIEPINSK
jgi:YbbR domain-containing protein